MDVTLAKFGKTFQERVVQAILSDYRFADQMHDVIQPKYFELKYLQDTVERFYDYKNKFKMYPSLEVLDVMLTRGDDVDGLVAQQVKEYFRRVEQTDLNGDRGFIEETSLEFCRKQTLKDGLAQAIDMMESGNYDSIQSVIRDALNKGATRDFGHNYNDDFLARGKQSVRKPIPTGWPQLDKVFNGGWEKGILATFIAPTGAGKSMFLVNCGAAAVAQGLNVVYVTLEMAEYKIGLRFDSYFSGVDINEVANKADQVQVELNNKVKGKLFIKEWPTKTASVQTIRAYLQRLMATQGFVPDMLVVDYADLLRGSHGFKDKRFELEGTYEELRALAQEFNLVVVTADQTNRSGLEMEVVTIAQIGESYSKATVCDVIMTISRRMEDKQTNSGRLFVAKSRLGEDGMIFPFSMKTSTVKATLLDQGVDPVALFMENNQARQEALARRYAEMKSNKTISASSTI